MSVVYSRRLKKELQEIQIEQADPAKRAAGALFYPRFHTRHRPERKLAVVHAGIQLLQAEDLKTWYFSIEVLGESLYKVRSLHALVFPQRSALSTLFYLIYDMGSRMRSFISWSGSIQSIPSSPQPSNSSFPIK